MKNIIRVKNGRAGVSLLAAVGVIVFALGSSMLRAEDSSGKSDPTKIKDNNPTDNNNGGGNDRSPERPPDKVSICHNGQTLVLPQPAAQAHLQQHPGDSPGACPAAAKK